MVTKLGGENVCVCGGIGISQYADHYIASTRGMGYWNCKLSYREPVRDITTDEVSNIEDQETNQSREIGV